MIIVFNNLYSFSISCSKTRFRASNIKIMNFCVAYWHLRIVDPTLPSPIPESSCYVTHNRNIAMLESNIILLWYSVEVERSVGLLQILSKIFFTMPATTITYLNILIKINNNYYKYIPLLSARELFAATPVVPLRVLPIRVTLLYDYEWPVIVHALTLWNSIRFYYIYWTVY